MIRRMRPKKKDIAKKSLKIIGKDKAIMNPAFTILVILVMRNRSSGEIVKRGNMIYLPNSNHHMIKTRSVNTGPQLTQKIAT